MDSARFEMVKHFASGQAAAEGAHGAGSSMGELFALPHPVGTPDLVRLVRGAKDGPPPKPGKDRLPMGSSRPWWVAQSLHPPLQNRLVRRLSIAEISAFFFVACRLCRRLFDRGTLVPSPRALRRSSRSRAPPVLGSSIA